MRPGIIGEIGTDKPWVSAREERVHRAVARAARRTGLAITTHAVLSPVGLRPAGASSRPRARTRRGSSSATPTRIRTSTTTWRSSERGAIVEFDFLGMSLHARRAARRGSRRRAARASCSRAATWSGCCSRQDVCHDSQLRRYEGNGYTYLADDVPAAAPCGGRERRGDRDDDGGEPASPADDRVDAGAGPPAMAGPAGLRCALASPSDRRSRSAAGSRGRLIRDRALSVGPMARVDAPDRPVGSRPARLRRIEKPSAGESCACH